MDPPLGPVVALTGAYLLVDALVGRQKLSQSMFLSRDALSAVVEQINETISQGRGIDELLGALLIFLPFAMTDLARRNRFKLAVAAYAMASLFVFYEAAISRGFVLVAVMAILAGSGMEWRRLAAAAGVALVVFGWGSFLRGDFAEVTFSNPLFDSIGWPYLNLALLGSSDCGHAGVGSYALEFAKKFLPAFLVPKSVFSFNIEMTLCIYPAFGDFVSSISVFTYVGEFLYYSPPWAAALLAGSLLALLAAGCDRLLARAGLGATRVFAGLMTIVLLRSRTQDVLSFLIFLLAFLGLWIGASSEWIRSLLARTADEAPAAGEVKE
jgi:hypothetical protein